MMCEAYLENQVALVTGAGRGIGREIALQLAQHGAEVVVNYRSRAFEAEELVARIEGLGGRALAVQADVSHADQAELLVQRCEEHFGRLDVLVNNAGPFLMKTFAETTLEEWHAMFGGNLHSAFYCTKFALPIMRRQGRGQVIFIGSIKADTLRARQNACAYGIAKTGVVLLARTLAREEGPRGIRANVINPGIIDTGRLEYDEVRAMPSQIPLRTLGEPGDIAQAVLFLLSPQARYCNGAVLNVDGGLWL